MPQLLAEWTEAVSQNLAAAFIWAGFGILAIQAYRFKRARRRTGFVDFTAFRFGKVRRMALIYGLIEGKSPTSKYSMDEGDVCALCSALSFLEKKYGQKTVKALSCHAARGSFAAETDIVLVSGPVWNEMTAVYLDQMKLPVTFEADTATGEDVLEVREQKAVYRTVFANGIARECYAIVAAATVQTVRGDESGQRVVVAAGISSLGTFGAVQWLRRLDTHKRAESVLGSNWKRGGNIVVLLRVEDRSPSGFRAYASDLDSPAFLFIRVIGVFQMPAVAEAVVGT